MLIDSGVQGEYDEDSNGGDSNDEEARQDGAANERKANDPPSGRDGFW